ncbi:MAG: hypothetical protein ACI4IW_07880 [Oscillospiraceae bacterium]
MTVYELNRDQLNELKNNWFWDYIDYDHEEDCPDPTEYGYPENIPDEIIYNRYNDFFFVPDDFFCTADT